MTSTLLNIGSRALTAAQGSLNTVSHNIANANTEGYSRQQAVLTTSGGQFTGAGFFGRGVELATVRRSYDQFLTTSVQAASATSAADQARATGLKALDAVFADSELGLGSAMDAFFAAAGDLANRPADTATRQVFLARAQQLADRYASVGGQVQQLVDTANDKLAYDAAQVNTRLDEIRKLNEQIARLKGTGQPPNDLLDQRDAAVTALNGLLAVKTVEQDDGTLAVFAGTGSPLLVGNQQARLESRPDPDDPTQQALRLTVAGRQQWMDAAALGGGSLAGTLRLRDEDLAAALNQVGRLAVAVADAFNSQQRLGVDGAGQPGKDLFSVPGPTSRPADTNTGSGSIAVAIVDPKALQPSDYEVGFESGAWTIRRLSDGQVTTPAAWPATVDGLAFTMAAGAASGDSWRVRPLATAAIGMAARPLVPREVATAYAAMASADPTNKGSGVATGFSVVRQDAANAATVTISFNADGTYNVAGLSSGALTNQAYTPGARLPASGDWNGWTVTLDGTPKPGDRFTIASTPAPSSDNRNALALTRLADAGLVAGGSLAQGYAALVGEVGNRVQSGQAAAQVSGQLQAEAVSRQQNVAGVNLDEEAADLLRFQQAYQACARIIQASQSLFDTLLAATGR